MKFSVPYTSQSMVKRRDTSVAGRLTAVRTMTMRTSAALGTLALATLAAVAVTLEGRKIKFSVLSEKIIIVSLYHYSIEVFNLSW